jgi:hypothetical protein
MADDFFPRPDADALLWMLGFSNGISSSPATYQLTPGDATTIATAVSEFQAALELAEAPLTRTPGNVNAKDTKRNLAETLCRQYAIQIKYNNGITDQAKIDIGVRPVNTDRTPQHCPQTSPLVNVTAATPGSHTVRFADSLEPNKRAKPPGAAGVQIFCHIGETPTVNEDDAKFVGMFTTNPIVVAYTPEDDGKMATIFARWSGKRGDTGPFSLPVSMRIAA